MAARSSPERSPAVLRANELTVLQKGRSVSYTISSFPALTILLRSVKLQWENDRVVVHVFDDYMRERGLLTKPLPLVAVGCMGQRSPVPWNNTNSTNDLISSSDHVPGHSAENIRRRTGTPLVRMFYGSFFPG